MINSYYIIENGQQIGPFTHEDLMKRGLAPNTQVQSPLANSWVSASQLPEFQDYFRIMGVSMIQDYALASFWQRLGAFLLDTIILCIPLNAIQMLVRFIGRSSYSRQDADYIAVIIALIIYVIYYAVMESSKLQATLGKKICKIKVVDEYDAPIPFFTALLRTISKALSALPCYAGFWVVLLNKKHQGWHDQLAGTYVVKEIQ